MKWLFLLSVLVGCAQVTSLNMRRHQFGRYPAKIVWFQVAGLAHEHLAMLRFGLPTLGDRTSFEQSTCTAQAWSFSLTELRPHVAASMLAQSTGKKDQKKTCEDMRHRPIWNYLEGNGFKSGIIEIGALDDESLLAAKTCGKAGKEFFGDAVFWSMAPAKPAGASEYLPQRPQEFKAERHYWDASCGPKGCGSSLQTAVSSLYGQFARNADRHVLIVRDFSYRHALRRSDFTAAREILREIERTVAAFYQAAESRSDVLVVVSGAASQELDFPAQGRDWQSFDLKGTGVQSRLSDLLVPVYAHGARAENFCGFYEENQIFERVLSGPRQQGLELQVINPFLN